MAKILTERTKKEMMYLKEQCDNVFKHTMVSEYKVSIELTDELKAVYVLTYSYGKTTFAERYSDDKKFVFRLMELLEKYAI
jgi:hypothetical protein